MKTVEAKKLHPTRLKSGKCMSGGKMLKHKERKKDAQDVELT